MITYEEFKQAKLFAFTDVKREIALAEASETEEGKALLGRAKVESGGGNFMAALALLCYTEFAGKLKYNRKKDNGRDYASENFNLFFDNIGSEYRSFRRAGHKVYDVFRCGLAHEYYTKKSCDIFMFGLSEKPGIGVADSGKYYFAVDRYCQDLEKAYDKLEIDLFQK